MAYLALVSCLLFISPAKAESEDFVTEWRREFLHRLAACFPGAGSQRLASGAIADILKTSPSQVSRAVNQERFEFTFAQVRLLSEACGTTVDHLLAFERLVAINHIEDLEREVRGSSSRRRALMIHAYVRARTTGASSVGEGVGAGKEFVERWRAAVRERLKFLRPCRSNPANKSWGYLQYFANLLNKDHSSLSTMLSGPQHLTWESAEVIAAKFKVKPAWILAGDLTAAFAGVDEIERATDGLPRGLTEVLIRLYGHYVDDRPCAEEMAIR